jgi:hypothetical protein
MKARQLIQQFLKEQEETPNDDEALDSLYDGLSLLFGFKQMTGSLRKGIAVDFSSLEDESGGYNKAVYSEVQRLCQERGFKVSEPRSIGYTSDWTVVITRGQ